MNDLYDERTDAEVSRRINATPFMTYKEECEALRERVEKLTKERDEYKSGFEAAASKYRNLKSQMQEIINVC